MPREWIPIYATETHAQPSFLSEIVAPSAREGRMAVPELRKPRRPTSSPHQPARPARRRCRIKSRHAVRQLSSEISFQAVNQKALGESSRSNSVRATFSGAGLHETLKARVNLPLYSLPEKLRRSYSSSSFTIGGGITEGIGNVTPADASYGPRESLLKRGEERIRVTLEKRFPCDCSRSKEINTGALCPKTATLRSVGSLS